METPVIIVIKRRFRMKNLIMVLAVALLLVPAAMAATRAPLGEDFTAGT
jgi:hypothetical protein